MSARSYERREGEKRGPTDEEEISRKQEAARGMASSSGAALERAEVVQLRGRERERAGAVR